MAGQTTVLSTDGGKVIVPSSGTYTAEAIQQVQALLNSTVTATIEVWGSGGVPPVPTPPGGTGSTYVLEIPTGVNTGSIDIPAGYGAVIFGQGSTGTVTGGDSRTTVLSAGALTYSGGAGEVAQTGTVPGISASINDTASGAVIDIGGGSYSVSAGGNQATIQMDTSSLGSTITATGSGDTLRLGDGTVAAQAAGAVGQAGTTDISLLGKGDVVTVNSANNLIADGAAGGSTTITGLAGSSTIFAAANDVYYGAAATTFFVSSAGSQTVFGGTAGDTVFSNGASITYNEGSGANNLFVNAGGSSTINGNGSGAVFTGGGNTTLVLGGGHDVFAGNGGVDSIYGGSVTATVFGGNNESANIIGSNSAFEVAVGSNVKFDASLSNGGNNFFVNSLTGNTSLTGSLSGGVDTFNLNFETGGSAHTITIDNFRTGDGLFLGGYSQADIQTMDQAVLGGKSSFTLSDGTTVVFQGQHPTSVSGSEIF